MAAADTEADPSVTAVRPESEQPQGRSRSSSPTPPASQARTPPPAAAASRASLADELAVMVARGEQIPGTADADILLEGDEEKERDLDSKAVAAQKARRQKKAKESSAKEDTDSGSDQPITKGRKPNSRESGGKGKRAREEGKEGPRGRDSGGKGKRAREVVELVSDNSDDVPEQKEGSRHLAVTVSQIYKDWAGTLLDEVRRRFQALMFTRDGYPLKLLSNDKKLNYKLVLRAAQAIMSAKDYVSFSGQMERAYKDTDKS